jgi:type II secretory pathway component PulC
MRAGLLVVVLVLGCGPKPSTGPHAPDDDLELGARRPPPGQVAADEPRHVAPPGKGLREGTISRAHLLAVLDAGPPMFLRQLEVAPRLQGEQFVGWQLVRLLDRQGPLNDVDVAPGDVLLAINGKPVSRPEQFQVVWDSLRTANEVTARLWRGDQKLELHFVIEPAVR